MVFDDRHAARYYVADGTKLWTNVDATTNTTFTDLSAKLTSLNLTRPTAVEFISHNGVNALLVGALSTVAGSASPLAVADSPTPDQLVNWRRFGNGIPNTIIGQPAYNPLYDVLAVGTFGRGAFLLYDVTTYFASATNLVYGAADNDSNPDAIWLSGNRPLEKVGTGTRHDRRHRDLHRLDHGLGRDAAGQWLARLLERPHRRPGRNRSRHRRAAHHRRVRHDLARQQPAGHAVGQRQPRLRSGQQLRRRRGGQRPERPARGGRRHVDRRRQRVGLRGAGRLCPAFEIHDPEFGGRRERRLQRVQRQPAVALPAGGYPGYDANNVYLTLQPGGFGAAAQTTTQSAVGRVLDATGHATGDFGTVLSALAPAAPQRRSCPSSPR